MNMQNKQLAPTVRDQESYAVRPSVRIKTRQVKSHHESADSYVGVIAQLDDRHRVILCKDGLQWIIQVRRGQRRRHGNWRGKSYITCPQALIRLSDALCGPLSSKTMDILRALPARPGGQS